MIRHWGFLFCFSSFVEINCFGQGTVQFGECGGILVSIQTRSPIPNKPCRWPVHPILCWFIEMGYWFIISLYSTICNENLTIMMGLFYFVSCFIRKYWMESVCSNVFECQTWPMGWNEMEKAKYQTFYREKWSKLFSYIFYLISTFLFNSSKKSNTTKMALINGEKKMIHFMPKNSFFNYTTSNSSGGDSAHDFNTRNFRINNNGAVKINRTWSSTWWVHALQINTYRSVNDTGMKSCQVFGSSGIHFHQSQVVWTGELCGVFFSKIAGSTATMWKWKSSCLAQMKYN